MWPFDISKRSEAERARRDAQASGKSSQVGTGLVRYRDSSANTEAQIRELADKLHVTRMQFFGLVEHLKLRVDRAPGQIGEDKHVAHWIYRERCKECGW